MRLHNLLCRTMLTQTQLVRVQASGLKQLVSDEKSRHNDTLQCFNNTMQHCSSMEDEMRLVRRQVQTTAQAKDAALQDRDVWRSKAQHANSTFAAVSLQLLKLERVVGGDAAADVTARGTDGAEQDLLERLHSLHAQVHSSCSLSSLSGPRIREPTMLHEQ